MILKDFPNNPVIINSQYSLEEIRLKLSYILENKNIDGKQMAILELILCLANEIEKLRNDIHNQTKSN